MHKKILRAFFCRAYLPLVVLPVISGCIATIPPSGFEPIAELPPKARIENDTYVFDVAPVSTAQDETPWRVYRHPADNRNTVLKSGQSNSTHTISVVLRHENLHPSKLRSFAKLKYPNIRFVASKETPNCIRSEPEKPMHFESGSYGYIAYCISPSSNEVIELAVQEKAIVPQPESPSLHKTMYTVFESFRFKLTSR